MAGRALAVTVVLAGLVLAGCVSGPVQAPPSKATLLPAPITLNIGARDCLNFILFQFLPFAAADAFLPPGYHARDPKDFLNSPAATGQAAAVVFLLDCASRDADGKPWVSGYSGVYVEPPAVPDTPDAVPLNFYEVEHFGEELNGTLASLGWPVHASNVSVARNTVSQDTVGKSGSITDANGLLFQFFATAAAPYQLALGPVRLWHETPKGTGYFQYNATLDAQFGPVVCILPQYGTVLGALIGEPTRLPNGGNLVACAPDRARLGATFPNLSFLGEFRFLPGVHAR